MSSLKSLEKRRIENLFGMRSGNVLDFTNRTFAEFFRDTVNIDIYTSKYEYASGSKANRLRAFWERDSDPLVGKVLSEMLEVYRFEAAQARQSINEEEYRQCKMIAARLLGKTATTEGTEDDFLDKNFGSVSLDSLKIESSIVPVLASRIEEAQRCLKAGASLAVIMLCGSTLEGILLGYAQQAPASFNRASSAPKDKEGKIRPFHDWTLSNFIEVAADIGLIKLDVKKFSHALRDFRNYIHPYQQVSSGFNPDDHTAKMCMQVLRAAIADLEGKR